MNRGRMCAQNVGTGPRAFGTGASLLVLLAGLSGCDSTDDGFVTPPPGASVPDVEVRYRTKYIDIALLADVPVCAGTLAMMDAHVEHVLGVLGLDIEKRIPVYLSREGDLALKHWCKDTSSLGCHRRDGVIFASMFAVYHELVHAITTIKGYSWWVEGAAHALAFRAGYSTPAFSGGWDPGLGESGHLSRWIIERYGGETYMELYASTPLHADQATVEAAVREVLDQEFNDLLSEYAQTAAYVYPDHLACHVPPGASESPWIDGVWAHEVTLDCDRPDTFSDGNHDEQRMIARVPITLPADGFFLFVADHADVTLELQPCLTEPSIEPIPLAASWPILLDPYGTGSQLRAGPHVLLVGLPPGAPASVHLAAYPAIGEHPVP